MREKQKPKVVIESYRTGVILHFNKSKYDNCVWSKSHSTWSMLKNRYDNGTRDSQMNKLYNAEYSLIPWHDENSMTFEDAIEKMSEVINNTWFRKKF